MKYYLTISIVGKTIIDIYLREYPDDAEIHPSKPDFLFIKISKKFAMRLKGEKIWYRDEVNTAVSYAQHNYTDVTKFFQ